MKLEMKWRAAAVVLVGALSSSCKTWGPRPDIDYPGVPEQEIPGCDEHGTGGGIGLAPIPKNGLLVFVRKGELFGSAEGDDGKWSEPKRISCALNAKNPIVSRSEMIVVFAGGNQNTIEARAILSSREPHGQTLWSLPLGSSIKSLAFSTESPPTRIAVVYHDENHVAMLGIYDRTNLTYPSFTTLDFPGVIPTSVVFLNADELLVSTAEVTGGSVTKIMKVALGAMPSISDFTKLRDANGVQVAMVNRMAISPDRSAIAFDGVQDDLPAVWSLDVTRPDQAASKIPHGDPLKADRNPTVRSATEVICTHDTSGEARDLKLLTKASGATTEAPLFADGQQDEMPWYSGP